MYAMVAAGLALMLGVARLINFAHGEFFMLGAYAFWFGYSELGLPYPVAVLLAPAVMVIFGVAYQRTVIRAILSRSWHVQLIATLATSIVLTNLAIIVLGTQPKEVPTALPARILDVGGFRMAWQRLLVLVRRAGDLLGSPPLRGPHAHRPRDARDVAEPRGVRRGGGGRPAGDARDLRALGGPGRSRRRARLAALQHLSRHGHRADPQGVRGGGGGGVRLRQRWERRPPPVWV